MNTLEPNPAAGNRKSAAALTPAELRARLDRAETVQLVDVREHPEFAAGRIAGSRLIPLGELERRAGEISRDHPVICICRSGRRATQAAGKLAALGLTNVARLEGGLLAWEQARLPLEKDANPPWALERQVRFTAGLLVLLGLGLSLIWPPTIGLSWFVGAGLVFAAVTDWCGMGLLLAKMPWNRPAKSCATGSCGQH
jgi:rhodanese-related sulfurtransferase